MKNPDITRASCNIGDFIWPVVGCYTLDLYCDRENPKHEYKEFPHQYGAEFGSQCRTQARLAGWVFHRNGYATCPKCNRAKK